MWAWCVVLAVESPGHPRPYDGPEAVAVDDPGKPVPPAASPAVKQARRAPTTGAGVTSATAPKARTRRPAPGAGEPEPARKIHVAAARPLRNEPDRAGSVVTRRELDEQLPRSAPDALRNEPGVYVQQTAHGQGSPFIRGLTGQQTAMYFDGVRLNNSTYRQGPNQYFFTVDSRSVQRIEVVRGSASTRYGSDAIGGALLATPIDPTMTRGAKPWSVHSRGTFATTTADSSVGGRGQVDVAYKGKVGLFAGVGYRDVNLLRSGGRILVPATGTRQTVPPVFAADDKTQLGTGFDELTADARLVAALTKRHRITLGYYDYRQSDAPRTDQCPPATAPEDECLRYNKQFRTLVYAKFAGRDGPAAARSATWTVSYQRQYEDRTLRRGSPSTTRLDGRDTVHSIGTRAEIRTKTVQLAPWAGLQVSYGAELYHDRVRSQQTIGFGAVGVRVDDPNTQYTDGAQYVTSGVWAVVETTLTRFLRLRGGGRGAFTFAQAATDPQRDSAGVRRHWVTGVGHGGIAIVPMPELTLLFNVDQGFRPPNIDDLTSRQITGPGYQFENSGLKPETSTMIEGGVRAQLPWLELEAFAFQTFLHDFIQRAPREKQACPTADSGCRAARYVLSLVNTPGVAIIRGAEGSLRIYLPFDFGVSARVSYAWGDSPNPRYGLVANTPRRAPISRVPPLNGGAELGWRSSAWGVYLVGALRWARKQDRLAITDERDVRIPDGGTPGYVVFDLRAGYRLDPQLLFSVVFENIGDAAYRTHGSAINGPGRGLLFEVQAGF